MLNIVNCYDMLKQKSAGKSGIADMYTQTKEEWISRGAHSSN